MADSQFYEKTLKRAEFCKSKCAFLIPGRRGRQAAFAGSPR